MKNTYRFIKSIGFILLILVFPFIISGQGIYNNGGKIVIGSGASVYVNSSTGNFRNETNVGDGAVILSGTLLIGGNLTNNVSSSDVFTNPADGSEVIFNGSAAQTIAGSSTATFHFNKLTLNNSKGVMIGGNVLVNNILNFQSGIITTGTNTLSLASDATITGAGTGKYVYGNLLWNIPTGAPSKTFTMGDNLNYAPATVAFTNVTVAGTLTGSVTNADYTPLTLSGIDGTKSVNHAYTLTNSGITFNTATTTLNWAGVGTDADAGSTPANYIVAKLDGSTWTKPTVASPGVTSIQTIGLTSFSTFQVGEPACSNPTDGGTIASDQTISSGSTPAAFTSSVAATGHTGTLEYKWQWSATSATANDFADIGSSNSATYAPGALSATTWYKRLARVSCKSDWTGAPESNVVAVTIGSLPITVSGSNTKDGQYASLTKASGAFSALNSITQTGKTVVITITADVTDEDGANGLTGASGMWTTLTISPSGAARTISGTVAAPLIDINGATNVTIDGRQGGTGTTKDLIISNLSTSTTQGTSAIRFINDASANTVKYCTIKGSSTASAGGILIFGTTTGTTGNDNNTIDHNDITNAGGNRPRYTLYSIGTGTDTENSGNTISNNNFYNFLPYTSTGSGAAIYLSTNNSAWTILGNSFCETTSFAPTSGFAYYAVYVLNTGSNYTISNNYIGGSAPLCEGTPWTKTNATGNEFMAIYVSSGAGTASNIQGNTIKNFNFANNNLANWWGIAIAGAGDVNIGTTAGNVIGASTGIESIVISSVSGTVQGINVYNCTGTINIRNNSIGAITNAGATSADSGPIYCIYGSMISGTLNIIDNTIGSATTPNSINASSSSTSRAQQLYGINISTGTADCTVSGNLIANINNAGTFTTNGGNRGISLTSSSASGKLTVTNNKVRNFSNDNITASGSINLQGIYLTHTGTSAHTISGNTVYDLSNTATGSAGTVRGGYISFSTTESTVERNFVHSLSVASAAAKIEGLYIYGGTVKCSNNIISLGTGLTPGAELNGIRLNVATANTMKFYHNTVYIGGTATGTTANTYALRNIANNTTRDYRNNIFNNSRSGGATGIHYAASITNTTNLTDCDYNDYYAPFGKIGILTTDRATLADWQLATGKDLNSINTDPTFKVDPPGSTANDYVPKVSLACVTIDGNETDYAGTTRAATPNMGALEFDVAPPCANPTVGGTISDDQSICSGSTPTSLASDSLPTGHTGTLEYKWQSSTTSSSSGFSDISSSNAATYAPGALTANTWYKRLARVTCATGWTGAAESNVNKITIDPVSVGGSITGSTAITYGSSTGTLTLSGNTGDVVKWEKKLNTGSWSDIANTGSTYSETPTSTGTWYYRARIKSGECSETNSDEIAITVSKAGSTITATGTTSFSYTGLVQGPAGSTVTGSTGAVTYSYSGTGTTTYIASATRPTNAGTYQVIATVAADANYSTATSSALAFTISKVALTITADDKTKDYGAALPTLTVSYTGLVNGDTAPATPPSVSTTATASSAVTTYPITATGAADGNYTISYTAGVLTVRKVALTITADDKTKDYGAALPTLTVSYTGLVNGDTAPATPPSVSTTATASSAVTTYPITATGAADGNYTISYTAGVLTVRKVALTITADDKTKDYGAALPTLTVSYTGLVNGDTAPATPPSISTTATASSAVTTYPITATGAADGNYTISYTAGVLTVGKIGLTITGASVLPKVYDGNTTAAITGATLSGVVGSDVVTLGGGISGTFATALVGTGKVVTTAMTLTGAASGNYTLTQPTLTGTIATKELTVIGAEVASKIFNNSTAATITGATLWGVVGSDDVTLGSNTSGTFASASAGTGIPVSTAMTISGAASGNYALTQPTLTGTITAKTLTVTGASVTSKVYDGNTTAAITGATLSGVVGTDVVTLGNATSGTFASASVGTGKTVTTAMTIAGAASGNYTLTQPTLRGTITAKTLTVTGAAVDSKVYDGTTAATITGATLSGVVGSDVVTLGNSTPGTFATALVGTGKVVNTVMTITGAASGNYTLTQPTLRGTITAKTLTVTDAAVDSKVYDGTTAATITGATLTGVVGSDAVTLGNRASGTFATAAAGTGKTVTTAMTITGAASANYTLAQPTPTGTITAKTLVVTGASVNTKIYDGKTAATLTGATLLGVVVADDVTLSNAASGTFARATVGAAIPVATSMTLSGTKAGNYLLTLPELTGAILVKKLVINPDNGQSKVYGQGDPVFTYTASPAPEQGDGFTGSLSRVSGENVGSYTYTAGSLSAGDNYSLQLNPLAAQFAVTPKQLTITASNGSKSYGDAYPFTGSEFVATGLINGNTVTAVTLTSTGAAATADAAGSPYPIVAGAAFGFGLNNYTITYVNGTLIVGTLPVLTITASNRSKIYGSAYTFDLTTPSADFSVEGLKNGDTVTGVTLTGTGTTQSAKAGSYPVTPAAAKGTGLENYTIVYTPGTFTVTPSVITFNTIYTNDKCYDGTTTTTLKNISDQQLTGITAGDVLTLSGTAAFATAGAGTAKQVNVTGLTLGGAGAANYALSSATATSLATIHPKPSATAGADRGICIGQSTILGTGVAGQAGMPGNRYAWSSAAGFTSPEANPSVSPATDALYSVIQTSEFGCVSDPAAVVIKVNPLPTISGTLILGAGSTTQLWGTGTPSATKGWSSGNTAVATISNAGLVTGVGAGSSVITYTTSSGCTATATVTVNPSNIISGVLAVCVGSPTQLTGLGAPTTVNPWVSANPAIATVSINGLVTGVSVGSCAITYTLSNGYSQSVTLKISSKPVISGSFSVTAGSTIQLTGSGDPSATNAWSSSNQGVGTVNSKGVVTGVSSGTFMVTFINSSGCSQSVTITVLPATPVVTLSAGAMNSSASQGNQWYYSATENGEGAAIPGATTQNLTSAKDGWYWTVVTQGGFSSEPSLRKYRLSADSVNIYNLYPVPNNGEFTLSIVTPDQQTFNVAIYDHLGKKIYELHNLIIDGEFTREINLRPAAPGVYLIVVRSEKEKEVLKMNIEN